MRKLLLAVVGLVLIAGVTYFVAGRAAGPSIQIVKPAAFVGAKTPLVLDIASPNGRLTAVHADFVQGDLRTPLLSEGAMAATDASGRIHLERTVGRENVPTIRSGQARITITATRPVLFGLRIVQSSITKDVFEASVSRNMMPAFAKPLVFCMPVRRATIWPSPDSG